MRQEVAAFKRNRILQEAQTLFFRKGFTQTTLDDVAAALGTTKQVIYYQFDSKAELLVELCLPTIELAIGAAESAMREGSCSREKLCQTIRQFVRIVVARQEQIALFYRETKHLPPHVLERIQSLRMNFQSMLIAMVKEGVKQKEFNVPDARLAALAIYGMTSWTYIWHRAHGAIDAEKLSDGMADLALRMVGANSPEKKKPRLN